MNSLEHLPSLETREAANWKKRLYDSLLAIGGALLITGVISLLRLYPYIPNISFAYLLIVLALASTRGLYAAILASLVSFISFDFFLVPPLYNFTIDSIAEWLALFFFLAVSIITSQLAAALRRRAAEANRREHETRILYELVREANTEEDTQRLLHMVTRSILDVFSSWGIRDCAILLPDEQGKLKLQASAQQPIAEVKLSPDEQATAAWVMNQGQTTQIYDVALAPQQTQGFAPRAVVRSTASLHPVRRYARMLPLKTGQKVVGVLHLSMEDTQWSGSVDSMGTEQERHDPQTAFFWTFLDQAISIIERARLRQESLQVELLRQTDALRSALLSSISHDLRTPLSSIKAAASSLLQEDVQWDEDARRSFATAIEHEADRLNRLVANLLDMSRIEGGALRPEKEWYPLDELLHDVLKRMHPMLQGRELHIHVPDDLPPVELDYLEIEQVVTNLIENVVRYTPEGSPVDISIGAQGGQMIMSIADRGPGIPPADIERIFDKFYRVQSEQGNSSRSRGSGLGLAVCRGLVEAHGGHIRAENRAGGGAIFRFTLPLRKVEAILHE